jgi:hypothetical protein
VKCKDCMNLEAHFEAMSYCEGKIDETIEDCLRGNCDDIHFSYFECDENGETIEETSQERECSGFKPTEK